MDCALFHLEQSAACGDLQALVAMAEIYLQLPHDLLAAVTVQVINITVMLFIMLYKMVLTFECVDEILKCDHSH